MYVPLAADIIAETQGQKNLLDFEGKSVNFHILCRWYMG